MYDLVGEYVVFVSWGETEEALIPCLAEVWQADFFPSVGSHSSVQESSGVKGAERS